MISIEDWVAIRALHARGIGIKTISKQMGVSRNTVRKALRSDDLPGYHRVVPKGRVTDPYLTVIEDMYFEQKFIGTRIFKELQDLGYTGSLSAVHRCLQKLNRDHPSDQALVPRMEAAPGEQAQFDWSEYTVKIAGVEQTVYAFRYILAFSRVKFTHFALNQELPTVLEALECGIRSMGGVPKRLLIDNGGQMVIEHRKDGAVRYHPEFLKLMGLYRIEPYACTPQRPQTKGKIERSFYTLEQHFIKGNSFVDFADLQKRAHDFDNTENHRFHRMIQQTPSELFTNEQPHLHHLPEKRYVDSIKTVRQVSIDGYISVDKVEYSVPPDYTGKHVWVTQPHGAYVKIYGSNGKLLCTHVKSSQKGSSQTLPEHRGHASDKKISTRRQFYETFSNGQAFFEKLEQRYGNNARYHAARIMDCRRTYHDESIDMALAQALAYGAIDDQAIRKILAEYPLKEAEVTKQQLSIPTRPTTRPLSYYGNLLN